MEVEAPRSEATGIDGRERARRALALETPDRPPLTVSFQVRSGGPGGSWLSEWPARAGADILEIPCPAAWPGLTLSPEEIAADPVAACAALLDGEWPDPLDPALYDSLRRTAASYPDRALFQRVPGLYRQIDAALGWDPFLAAVSGDAALVGELMARAVTLVATVAGEALRHGAQTLVLVEELPTGEARRATAEGLERWVFPLDGLLLEGPAASGAPIVAWCPSATGTCWARFVAMGARALGPLPLSDGAISRLREQWHAPVGVYGARETGPLLAKGEPEAIRRHVAEAIARAGPGLILAAPDLPPRTPMGSLETFLAAVRESVLGS